MLIQDTFAKDIHRPINGVVKVDQADEAITWQELEEYVITRELDQHLRIFFETYAAALAKGYDPYTASQMGIWISGFFGSGKSHFLKILSYLLENRKVCNPFTGEEKRAIEFFKDKVHDPMLYAEMQRVANLDNQVILFNIDSRADPSEGRRAILSVLWKLFNEMQGFCPDYPYIAEIEKYLAQKGCYQEFCSAFESIAESDWLQERDAFELYEDEVVQALSQALSRPEDKTRGWMESLRRSFSMSVEGFAQRVKEYLDSFGPEKRIVFLIDEVGQFIGTDTHLMLNLQTITEDLGRICGGRAWLVVTSQEDVDAIIGDLPSSQANDFSKIQGRFKTRLTLSSANTDEVIQERLLKKKSQAVPELQSIFQDKGDILKSQLSFSSDNPSLRNFTDQGNFTVNYPFTPFQFQLLQKVFESIRKVGATGKHLAMGERSMLDAFQSAAQSVSQDEVGKLVPLHAFYSSIESFLDTSVKRSVDQAWDHPGLQKPFDVRLLQSLFLIRYVDIVRPNVENLVTLSIAEVDADRLSLKREIEAAVQRLERENLINRSGDLYFFLTNEEREVNREIKSTELVPGEEAQVIGEVLFSDILKDKNKHRFQANQRDYAFQRICDGKVFGGRGEFDLAVEVVTPVNDEYTAYNQAKSIIHSSQHQGRLLVVLPDRQDFIREVRTLKQTDKYIRNKSDAASTSTFKRIVRDKQEENQERRKRLVGMLQETLPQADMYALGNSFEPEQTEAKTMVEEGLEYLIGNTYNKFHYLERLTPDPLKEIRYILTADDVAQGKLIQDGQEVNSRALSEVREYIRLKTASSQPVVLNELRDRFAGKPYGWPEWEIILLVARMFRAGEIDLIMEGGKQEPKNMVAPLSQTRQWKSIKIYLRKKAGESQLKQAREIGKELFGQIGPEGQEQLVKFLKSRLSSWKQRLESFKMLADTGNYPGKKDIDNALSQLGDLLGNLDSYEFISRLIQNKNQLLDMSEDLHELQDFYTNQIQTWEELRQALVRFRPNRNILEQDQEAGRALKKMQEIVNQKRPYSQLKDVRKYISQVEQKNQTLLEEERASALSRIDQAIQDLQETLDQKNPAQDLQSNALGPLQEIRDKVEQEGSIPDIRYFLSLVPNLLDQAQKELSEQTSAKGNPEDFKAAKSTKQVRLSELGPKSVLETEEEVNSYVERIRQELLQAIQSNQKVRIL